MEHHRTMKSAGMLYQQLDTLADTLEQDPKNKDVHRTILGALACNRAPTLYEDDMFDDAPFSEYATNSDASWQYQPEQTIRDYLGRIPFVAPADMPDEHSVRREVTVASELAQEEAIIPLRYIVNAAGFDSWEGRRGMSQRSGNGDKVLYTPYHGFRRSLRSIDVMKHYASLSTSLPPIHTINLYVQPENDMIFGDNASGDSHRIGAAMLRGAKSVRAKNIAVHLLKPN